MPSNSSLSKNSSLLTPNSLLKKDFSLPTPYLKKTPYCLLLTGGCGFIGTSLIKHLLENNQAKKIRVLDNLSVGQIEDLESVLSEHGKYKKKEANNHITYFFSHSSLSKNSLLVELIVGDIRDPATAEVCCQNMDIIAHLAANTGVGPSVENPRLDMECNVIGTVNMLEGARIHKVKRFILASSGAPVGECKPPIHEEMAPHPVSPYGASKLAGEGYCSAYFRSFGVKTVALRFGNVYGPGSGHKNSVVAKFIRQAMRGETLEIYGDGTQTRDFIYIDDLIQAICLAINPSPLTPHSSLLIPSDPWGEIFQIATNAETTVSDLVDNLLPILANSGFKDVEVRHVVPRLGDVRRNFSDTSKAQRLLGWEAEVELDEGLERTVEWFTNL